MAMPQVVIPGFAIFHVGLEGEQASNLTPEDEDDADAFDQLDEIEQPG